jgi:hypothetical protein
VPVITVPLALWRTTASTVHPADLPASHRRRATRRERLEAAVPPGLSQKFFSRFILVRPT